MPLLRSNLTCFYCGTKSSLKRDPRIRDFACRECEAVNYLDEVRLFVCLFLLLYS